MSEGTLILIIVLKVFIMRTYFCNTYTLSFQHFKNTGRDLHTKVHMSLVTDGERENKRIELYDF